MTIEGLIPGSAASGDSTGQVEIIGPPDGAAAPAEVFPRTDGVVALQVADDCTSFQAVTIPALVAGEDTTITFAQTVRLIRVLNWSTSSRILAKDGDISDPTDVTATLIDVAPVTGVAGKRVLPFVTDSIHVMSPVASEVTVEGYF